MAQVEKNYAFKMLTLKVILLCVIWPILIGFGFSRIFTENH